MAKFWNKLLRKKEKRVFSEEDTIPIKTTTSEMGEKDVTKPLSPLPDVITQNDKIDDRFVVEPSQLSASCAQSTGRQRKHNEDSIFCLTTIMTGNGGTTSFGLYIVADGMGGHQHGEVASEVATRTMSEHIIRTVFSKLIGPVPEPPNDPLQEIMKNGILKAHNNVLEKVSGGGTTLTAVIIFSNQMTIAHVGDSRIYAVSLNGEMTPLTRDHSLVKRLEELGQLTPKEAAVDPRRNVLYHALGQGTPLEPEVISAPLPKQGYLLVCSDGLWGVITEEQIGKIITSAETLPLACQQMVDAANEAGGPDNISAILIRLPD